MDAVELNYPVDVAAAGPRKLMGSAEGCGGGGGGSSDRAAAVSSRGPIERCSSLGISEKDGASSGNALESSSWDKVPNGEPCENHSQLRRYHSEDWPEQLQHKSTNETSWIPTTREVLIQRRAGKVSRNANGCSKKPRTAFFDDPGGPSTIDDKKGLSDKLGSYDDSHATTQLAKQKNSFGSKRGDRRNAKVSMKTKHDPFSVKMGLASFSSGGGGNNFYGLHGLKTDPDDITKLVEDLSLNDLLDGTCQCPSLGKDKEKKAVNTTEDILNCVKNACSILQLPRPVQSQNITETDCCLNEKTPACTSGSPIVSNGDNIDGLNRDLSSCNKDSCSRPERLAKLLDFSFDRPKDTLEHLVLPPPKDLESLLLEAVKPTSSSKSAPDSRPSKHIIRHASLPPFTWSNTSSGHCRTNSDAHKFLTSRSSCQGRWASIGSNATCLGVASDCFTNLDLLTYDENLVPKFEPKLVVQENNIVSSISVPWSERALSSAPASITSHVPLVEHCPRLVAAAQILCDIATRTLRLNQDGLMRWPKKPSQKAMKARKSKLGEKSVELTASTSLKGSKPDCAARGAVDKAMPSKRLKLSTTENKKDFGPINGVKKVSIDWSAPRSSRSSPNEPARDGETRHSSAYILKHSGMMPPSEKVTTRTCNGQQKVRKLMRMDWNRRYDRQDR